LADELVQIVNRAPGPDGHRAGQLSSLLVKTASAPTTSIGRPGAGARQPRGGPSHVGDMLEDAQTSLSELRTLARQASGRAGEDRSTSGTEAVTRLAGKVDNLLEMIEPTPTRGPDCPSRRKTVKHKPEEDTPAAHGPTKAADTK
jgi:hypothetical protein